jgi:hypothetical protein
VAVTASPTTKTTRKYVVLQLCNGACSTNQISKNTHYHTYILIFTDGSRSEGRVGLGLPIYKSGEIIDTIRCRLSKKRTHNQAEQLAILIALEDRKSTNDK